MQQGRFVAFGEATEGKIFVAGGLNQDGKVSKRCEMYNVSTNEWQYIGSLNHFRVYGSMVCLKGTLYVLGGTKSTRDSLLAVESYDLTKDEWIEKTIIPVERFSKDNKDSFTSCVVKLSKGVMDKANLDLGLGPFGTWQSQTAFGTGSIFGAQQSSFSFSSFN